MMAWINRKFIPQIKEQKKDKPEFETKRNEITQKKKNSIINALQNGN